MSFGREGAHNKHNVYSPHGAGYLPEDTTHVSQKAGHEKLNSFKHHLTATASAQATHTHKVRVRTVITHHVQHR